MRDEHNPIIVQQTHVFLFMCMTCVQVGDAFSRLMLIRCQREEREREEPPLTRLNDPCTFHSRLQREFQKERQPR